MNNLQSIIKMMLRLPKIIRYSKTNLGYKAIIENRERTIERNKHPRDNFIEWK